jgi:urate oxidase
MAIRLAQNNYGKSRVRLFRVARREERHDVQELTVAIGFEGDFEAAHTLGDNSKILPTDTMKNTVYALARQNPGGTVEEFCLQLVEHFLQRNPQLSRVRIDATETLWARLAHGGKLHDSAFTHAGEEQRTAQVSATRAETIIHAGIANLFVLKTTDSAFENFLRDEYTTLKQDRNRILATLIRADWLYTTAAANYDALWTGVRKSMIEAFVQHQSLSLQHTLYAMGEAVLRDFESIREIRLSLPNKHFNLVDLAPLGMDNPGEVFLPTEEPHGLIEATIKRE